MVFHTCKTTTTQECRITSEERAPILTQVSSGNFLTSLAQAREMINGTKRQVECRRYQDTFSLPMKRNLFGLLTIRVQVNQIPCTFILDTGAQISGIKAKKARELGLLHTDRTISIGSVGGKEQQMQGMVAASFQFGAIEYVNLPMIALNEQDFSLRFGSIDLFTFDGILGWDILSTLDFEMDDVAKQFKVLKNRFRMDQPNMIKGGFPLILAKTPKQELAVFGFDSGSKISWIGEKAIDRFHYHVKEEGIALGFGVHGPEKMQMKVVADIELYIYKARIQLKDTGTGRVELFHHFTFDGVLGNEIFKGRRLRIVNSKQMILIA